MFSTLKDQIVFCAIIWELWVPPSPSLWNWRNLLATWICELFRCFPFVSFHVQVLSSLNISGSVGENTYYTHQSKTDAFVGILYKKSEISGGAEVAFDDQETKPRMQPWTEKEELVTSLQRCGRRLLAPLRLWPSGNVLCLILPQRTGRVNLGSVYPASGESSKQWVFLQRNSSWKVQEKWRVPCKSFAATQIGHAALGRQHVTGLEHVCLILLPVKDGIRSFYNTGWDPKVQEEAEEVGYSW